MATSITRIRGPLTVIISLLALADGVLHLSLNFVLFRGNLFGALGPPPGAPRPPGGGGPPGFLVPLNQAFTLNLVGYVVLVLIFLFVGPRLGSWQWIVDVVFILYVATVFLAWLNFGAPNPRGLGYLSKSIEVLLVLALLAHLWVTVQANRVAEYAGVQRTARTSTDY
jgi:hypothetical protein